MKAFEVTKDGVVRSFYPDNADEALLETALLEEERKQRNQLQGKCNGLEAENTRLRKSLAELQAQLLAEQDRIIDLQGKLLKARQ
jgi:hypothetical protein